TKAGAGLERDAGGNRTNPQAAPGRQGVSLLESEIKLNAKAFSFVWKELRGNCTAMGKSSTTLSVLCLITVLAAALAAAAPAAPASQSIDFKRDIQPIFAERCYSCHGPEK